MAKKQKPAVMVSQGPRIIQAANVQLNDLQVKEPEPEIPLTPEEQELINLLANIIVDHVIRQVYEPEQDQTGSTEKAD